MKIPAVAPSFVRATMPSPVKTPARASAPSPGPDVVVSLSAEARAVLAGGPWGSAQPDQLGPWGVAQPTEMGPIGFLPSGR
jgi:hypothetical protein